MSNFLMAPLPEHGQTSDPLWLKLWHAYEPLITSLRCLPLLTNVEISGGMFGITTELNDGSHLWISSVADLPLNPAEAEGFQVTRRHFDNPTVDELIYDSTEDGAQSEHRNNPVPLLQAVAAFVRDRQFGPEIIDLYSVYLQAVTAKHEPLNTVVCGRADDRQQALACYEGFIDKEMTPKGWRRIHEQGGTEWPVSVWECEGEVVTVSIVRDGEAILR
ncbi:hypothetical protein [Streptomyces flavofungini]|uniref:hypothetical protein n=1 Tax=Streptomyces flavofungini TaxID=68200 RepID=UPI0025AEE269|nr:hypothetical protein [Streptomyces flavofungini]WJV48925.1 hypothetical protein QUY26_27460 [Streptomyces flavofungini]